MSLPTKLQDGGLRVPVSAGPPTPDTNIRHSGGRTGGREECLLTPAEARAEGPPRESMGALPGGGGDHCLTNLNMPSDGGGTASGYGVPGQAWHPASPAS